MNGLSTQVRKPVGLSVLGRYKSYDVHFDITGPMNLTEIVPVVVIEGMVSRIRPRCIGYFITPSVCSGIKPAAMEN